MTEQPDTRRLAFSRGGECAYQLQQHSAATEKLRQRERSKQKREGGAKRRRSRRDPSVPRQAKQFNRLAPLIFVKSSPDATPPY